MAGSPITAEAIAEAARSATQAAHAAEYPRMSGDHAPLGAGLRLVIFLTLWGAISLVGLAGGVTGLAVAASVGSIPALLVSRIVRVAAEWERAVVLRFGRYHEIKGPGIFPVFPVADTARFVDTRLLTQHIPRQQVITRDNVPVRVDAVLFFKVNDPAKAVTSVQDYRYAVAQFAQASLRDVIGSMSLDGLLSEREEIQGKIGEVMEERTMAWGIHIDTIRLLDIDMPEDLKRMMSREASAEREKRATITKSEGDRDAANNLAAAAETMAASPGAMQLRTLQTLDGLGTSSSNTVVLAVPVEMMEAVRAVAKMLPPKRPEETQG